ncbi:AbrB/MazE/SpoVT family DNA-binding domain-containing protein [Candidatus Woesearchaeota archaeon]|nr:AbrB/MazE/SpoVT family DNA-binding domain-containing protein [Candidatus Woesearchaeota archaeon]
MTEIIEMGKISSRGQIAIPSDIRREMDLKEGEKVLFLFEEDTLLIKKVSINTFEEITRPLREAAKKAGIKESDVPEIVHRFRAKKKK